jgi:Calpain family cysteine protease
MRRRRPRHLLFLLTLVAAGTALWAQETPRSYALSGWHVERGYFRGVLTLQDADGDGVLEAERRLVFQDESELVERGRARQRGNWIRAAFPQHVGLTGGLTDPDAPAREAVVQVKLDLDAGTCWSQSWLDDRRVSRSRGLLLGADVADPDAEARRLPLGADQATPLDQPSNAHHEHVLPYDPDFRAGAPSEERPSLDGTSATSYQRWKGVPFVQGEGDERAVDMNDVAQGAIGDCYLISAMIAVARTDPQAIEDMILDNGDGTYKVRLWDLGRDFAGASVTVDDQFPATGRGRYAKPAFARLGDQREVDGEVQHELWPLIIEKAWAKYRGGYEHIGDFHSSGPLSFISGAGVSNYDPADMKPDALDQALRDAVAKGHPTILGVTAETPELRSLVRRLGLHWYHAYVLVDAGPDGFKLYNPWAHSHPTRPLTADEIHQLFMCAHAGRF